MSAPEALKNSAFVTGQVQDGTYQVTNAQYTTLFANLSSGNVGTPVADTDGTQDQSTFWTVTNGNVHGQYTIKSFSYATFAGAGANPSPGDIIKAKSSEYTWKIVENNQKSGQYFISAVSDDLYWNLINNTKGTNVSFTDGDGDNSQWQFTMVDTGASGVLQQGTYQMTNVKNTTLAFISKDEANVELTQSSAKQDEATKWIVTPTNVPGQYTIENYKYQDLYAMVGANPSDGTAVKSGKKTYSWIIKENNNAKGQYFITPVGSDLYWHLINNSDGTSITLSASGDTDSQWTFA